MKDMWIDRLSEYLDGALEQPARDGLERHIAECGDCRATLAELRLVVARARALEDRPPARDLWPGIRARMTPGRRPGVNPPGRVPWSGRRVTVTVPQLAAASVALVLLSAGTALKLGPGAGSGAPAPVPSVVTAEAGSWARYDTAVAQLEEALARNRDRLDTTTVRVLEHSLATIDRAVAQAQRALAADPSDPYLNLHLARTLRRKLELLRRANAIASART